MPAVEPPERFGIVAPQVYRSSVFHPVNFSFLDRLKLKTIVHLSPEVTLRAVGQMIQDNGIRLVHLGIKFWRPSSGWKPMSDELLKEALELVLDERNHPLMLMCTSGVHQTGTVIGCLRKLQRFSFTSIIDELRGFASPGHTRYANENLIEFFDVDLVSLPEQLPSWFERHVNMPPLPVIPQGKKPPAYLSYLNVNSGPLVSVPLKTKQKSEKGDKGEKAASKKKLLDSKDSRPLAGPQLPSNKQPSSSLEDHAGPVLLGTSKSPAETNKDAIQAED